ncbi:isoleucine biosynthesis transcriptional activator [Massilia varians]|uniref:Isoleucine biosynthesis transcriptional activator n=1 Tax=Massilia varians TaxID=457921 RepID=A0ABM8CBU9_9BURK|nr:LysR family transcriptional regulator [Massilia varians]BDT60764.1 isoleucine biosynthesis transcriptional activator [Massilia varians]
MNLELRQLRHFVTVAEELHFGRAAERLHMTQPPLSQSIAGLEELLGAALFLRNRRQVALTAAGSALLPEARRLLGDASALPGLVRRAAEGRAGRLTLAFVSTADYSVLPAILQRYRAAFPDVQLVLREATSDVQAEELLDGRIDAGFVIPPLPEQAGTALDYRKVLEEPLILCAPAGLDALAGSGPVRLRDLPPLPLVIFPRAAAPALYDAILSCFRAAGITPVIGQEALQMQTIVSLVSGGMGLALVPQSVSNLMRAGVEYRALVDPTPLAETGLAWRRDSAAPVLRGFLDLIEKE